MQGIDNNRPEQGKQVIVQHDSTWQSLSKRARISLSVIIIASLGIFGTGVAFLEITRVSLTLFSDYIGLFIIGLLSVSVAAVAASFYMLTANRGSTNALLGSLWLLTLLPMAVSMYTDTFSGDFVFMVLIVFTAIQYWRGHANARWVLIAGMLTLWWFITDPEVHIITALTDPSFFTSSFGPLSQSGMQLALRYGYGFAYYDLIRLSFFAMVLYLSVRNFQTRRWTAVALGIVLALSAVTALTLLGLV